MKLFIDKKRYFQSNNGLDISIPLSDDKTSVLAWYCEPITIEPVVTENFIGEVKQGGSVNFRNVKLNLHGNGTHTECVGHISEENYTINQCLKEFHFITALISVTPKQVYNEKFRVNDLIIDAELISTALESVKKENDLSISAIVIRTLPNAEKKQQTNYSNTNPAYLTIDAIEQLNKLNIDHLLIDLPSVDREVDDGILAAHHLFWNYPDKPWLHKTITELVYVSNDIKDGIYVMNILITSLETDASPSKIVLYQIVGEE